MSVALWAVTVFTLAVVAVAVLAFHAAVTVLLACIRDKIIVMFIRTCLGKTIFTYRIRAYDHNAPSPFRTCSNGTNNRILWRYTRFLRRLCDDRVHVRGRPRYQVPDRETRAWIGRPKRWNTTMWKAKRWNCFSSLMKTSFFCFCVYSFRTVFGRLICLIRSVRRLKANWCFVDWCSEFIAALAREN